jgi:Tfp pilus assembly protein PilW
MLIWRRARSERGFTLIETLVAMVTGLVVTGALFAILEVSLHQNARITDKVQADQVSRNTMNKVVDALHSACLSPGFTPVQSGSTANKLIFQNAYSSKAAIPSASEGTAESVAEGAYKHEMELETSTGKLIDKAYPSTSISAWPTIVYSTTAKTTVLGEHISQTGSTPVFEYLRYKKASNSESENVPIGTLEAISPPTASATAAKEVAAIVVSFNTSPSDANTKLNRSVDLKSQVTFAFSAPGAETPVSDAPCE